MADSRGRGLFAFEGLKQVLCYVLFWFGAARGRGLFAFEGLKQLAPLDEDDQEIARPRPAYL